LLVFLPGFVVGLLALLAVWQLACRFGWLAVRMPEISGLLGLIGLLG
jgi:hypothetical protein